MSLRLCGLLGLFASACLWAGAKGSIEVVRDPDVLEFAQRIELFYDELEGRSINVFHTFQDPVFRDFFLHEEGFVDYYASLASQLRAAHFRHGRPVRVEIREFRFENQERAMGTLMLVVPGVIGLILTIRGVRVAQVPGVGAGRVVEDRAARGETRRVRCDGQPPRLRVAVAVGVDVGAVDVGDDRYGPGVGIGIRA